MLAYLALEGPTPKARIAGMLWLDSPQATARNNLRQTLAAEAVLAQARTWLLEVAEHQVPPAYREGFLNNPAHRPVLETARDAKP